VPNNQKKLTLEQLKAMSPQAQQIMIGLMTTPCHRASQVKPSISANPSPTEARLAVVMSYHQSGKR